MTLDPAARKHVLRSFTYGLYAVSATLNDEHGIFTANWLTQVSFDPPLIALSVERDSSTLPLIRGSGRFVISPFIDGQKELAGTLGRPKSRAGDKFESAGVNFVTTSTGDRAFASGTGFCVCSVRNEIPTGDSIVIIGEVTEARVGSDKSPLTMREAGFRHAG